MPKYYQGLYTPRNPSRYVGDPSKIYFRSSWERHFLEWLDTASCVISYSSEELQIPYYLPTDGKWHRYFPDFLVKLKDKHDQIQIWLVEIKPFSQTQHPDTKLYRTKAAQRRYLKESKEYAKNQAKWAAASAFCQGKKWKFIVLTEKDLFRQFRYGK